MADPRVLPKTPQTQSLSYIPVITPRAVSKSALPSSLSVPQLALGPAHRQVSASGSPGSFSTPPSSGSSPHGTGLPSLRSLRSLLPFSSGKSVGGGASPSSFPSSFGFGAARRSMTAERKASGSYLRAQEEDDSPVIAIQASSEQRAPEGSPVASGSESPSEKEGSSLPMSGRSVVFPKQGHDADATRAIPRYTTGDERQMSGPGPSVNEALGGPSSSQRLASYSDLSVGRKSYEHSASPASAKDGHGPPVITYTPDPPLSSELSTILESDLSGMSKHLPAFDDSRDSGAPNAENEGEVESPDGRSLAFQVPLLQPEQSKEAASHSEPQDTSALDLSTTHLTDEVMRALKEKRSGGDWLAGCIVQDAVDSRPPSVKDGEDPGHGADVSFHLESLDPDLAALLSPNRMIGKQPGLRTPDALLAPSPPPPQNGKASVTSAPRTLASTDSRMVTPQSSLSPLTSPVENSPSDSLGSQSSPARVLASLSRSSVSRGPSSSVMPRLMRSITDRNTTSRAERTLGHSIAARAASDSSLPLDEGRRASSDGVYLRRAAPPSPLSSDSAAPPLQQPVSIELRRPTSARTPARPPLYNPVASRLNMRPATSSDSPSSWDAESASPSSRAPSALGMASSRRVQRMKPSADDDARSSSSTRDRLPYPARLRNRSFSVGEDRDSPRESGSGGRPTTEWIGPKTAKAFAAAGLLDYDRESSVGSSAPGSRYASVRSPTERDYRLQNAPSRLAFSEAGSASSWRSAASAHGGPLDSISTTPRTTFSTGSTAPTSVSGASSPQHMQATLQTLQDKHALETGTLLAALADSQRTAQALREENASLTARVQELEGQLSNAHAQLRHQYTPPLARSVLDRNSRPASGSSDGLGRRFQPRTQQTLGLPDEARRTSMSTDDTDGHDATYRVNRSKRTSAAESLFALPPSNMSLLLQEDALTADRSHAGSFRSMSPPSPPPAVRRHRPNMSMSSMGNSSINEVPASPRSLFLRPEHELHLGDMASLDLRFEEDEDDEGG
ncbi:hypothetical protein BV25DRAFT_1826817 [Artomyces pyxidatus]|uniref:Uncharacterized protein n=1 Tax=Artomyces pyxidatus TaxID=48021 RepID=A0ACB8SZQ4_9AGAM|nr:hypothetical protein BV25DRAFT_1826817 [Artomyces pyxidatus]